MAYLMHIGFDNSSRIWKDVYYFEYKSIRYKLIQNNIRKWCDVLLTIIPNDKDTKAMDYAYMNASEFLSALSWENNSQVKVRNLGGAGIPDNFKLRNAKCRIYSFPQVPFSGYKVGYDINRIPEIETVEHRDALILFREASSSNNDYLAFLFFWQVIEIGKNDAVGWINKAYQRKHDKIRFSKHDLDRLHLIGKKIGNYLYDDCRNAIAHIHKREPGKVKIKIDTPADNTRIILSTRVIKDFARFYIKDKLQLQKKMWLVRIKGKGFSVFANEDFIKRNPCVIAYKKPSLSLEQMKKKRWH